MKKMPRQNVNGRDSLLIPLVFGGGFSLLAGLSACHPRVELAAPEKPITINMNIKIDHEVKVNIEKDLDKVISKDSKLF